jgi:Ser/Thr protein kinase RdoA (MazF antagonist)
MKKISEGREAEVFELDAGSVLKLFRPGSAKSCEREWVALTALPVGIAPAAVEQRTVDGRPGIVMELVCGSDLLTLIGAGPWRLPALGALMGRTHARVHEAIAPTTLPRLRERMTARISSSPHVPDKHRADAIAALEHLDDGDRVCHGDFHPGNLLKEAESARVLDWPNAAAGDPHADVAATMIILQLGEPTESSPWVIRKLHRVGRGLLRSRYLAGYIRSRRVDLSLVERWMLPVAVDRLSHGIAPERERLLAVIAART